MKKVEKQKAKLPGQRTRLFWCAIIRLIAHFSKTHVQSLTNKEKQRRNNEKQRKKIKMNF